MVGSLNSGDTRTGYRLDVAYCNYVLIIYVGRTSERNFFFVFPHLLSDDMRPT
jgi:hypothetical protein